jgi:hypothetical protein
MVASGLLLGLLPGVRRPKPPEEGIIARLSAEAFEEAKACGRAGAECATAPYLVCPAENARYSIRVATPFSRVASAALDAVQSGRPGRGMDRANANRWGIGVYVLPAERSAEAAGIESVEIRRDGQVIRPLTTTVGPIAVPMPDGSSRRLDRGYFAFPPGTFAPTSDVTMALFGSSGESACIITRGQLEKLR